MEQGKGGRRSSPTGKAATALLSLLALAVPSLFGTPPARAAAPPQIDAAWSTEVAATSARLRAEINPEGSPTAYHFNYITQAAYEANLQAGREGFFGAARVPTGSDPSIGSGTADVSAQQLLGALSIATAYRYRVVAHSAEGTVEAGGTFTTQGLGGASPLLDGRGWEMVSPVEKNGGAIQGFGQNFGGDVLQAAASGEAVTYSSSASFAQAPEGAPPASQYISRRGTGGWATQNITLPTLSGAYGDHPNGVPYQLFSTDLARGLSLNGGRCGEGEQCPRGYSLRDEESGALLPSPEEPDLRFAGSSPDLHYVILSTCAALTPDATEQPVCESGGPNLYRWSGGALWLVNRLGSDPKGTSGANLAAQSGAVSSDGSRIYFTVGEPSALYLREGEAGAKLVSEAGSFQTASADGRFAFFIKEQAGSGKHLYRYEATSEATTDLTPSGEVQGVLGSSQDGSYVYYATGAGLFLWHAPGTITELAPGATAAAPSDYPPTTGTARVSSDGAHLTFLSAARLTGYDNTDQKSGEPDTEVYLYDAEADELTCASCNPTNERPLGPSTISGATANGEAPGATNSYKPRDLSADGRRLFFDSRDALVLQDTNNAPDVYEWESPGEGSCQRSAGCVALISSGRSSEGASFVDASANGSDAFFLTDGSLVSSDPGSFDLYDAREGGGFPEPERPIACEGDACQPLVAEPEDPNPGTLLPSAGNPPLTLSKPRRCKKGLVRKHGRCVRKVHHERRGRR